MQLRPELLKVNKLLAFSQRSHIPFFSEQSAHTDVSDLVLVNRTEYHKQTILNPTTWDIVDVTYITPCSDNNIDTLPLMISRDDLAIVSPIGANSVCYVLADTNYLICVHTDIHEKFCSKLSNEKIIISNQNATNEFTLFEQEPCAGIINHYETLCNLLIMVKDAGDTFKQVLLDNLPYVDRVTILDTGSTDNTVQTIQTLFKENFDHMPCELYQEPFINFRDSRNRLIDLASTKCFFNIMLDDSYVLHNGSSPDISLRQFLEIARTENNTIDSYSIVIADSETIYTSNRIIRSDRPHLRYKYKIHEIIEPKNNVNAAIPYEFGYVSDSRNSYMLQRTNRRKLQDIELLHEEIQENPEDPRNYYYLADSYVCLKDWNSALKWFKKRAEFVPNERQITTHMNASEYQDTLYYIAAIKDQFLNVNWDECLVDYMRAYEADPTRAESLYVIGHHYFVQKQYLLALMFFRLAFELGLPTITMSVRKFIYYINLPRELAFTCYFLANSDLYNLGMKASQRYLDNVDSFINDIHERILTHDSALKLTTNNDEIALIHQDKNNFIQEYQRKLIEKESMTRLIDIFYTQKIYKKCKKPTYNPSTHTQNIIKNLKTHIDTSSTQKQYLPVIVFISPGGWSQWTGKTLETKGLGGAETFTIRYGEYIASLVSQSNKINTLSDTNNTHDEYFPMYSVVAFTNTDSVSIHKNVIYAPCMCIPEFLYYCGNICKNIIINRYPQYIPVCDLTPCKKIYFVYHDTCDNAAFLPSSSKLQIMCLSEWHKNNFLNAYPSYEPQNVNTVRYAMVNYGYCDFKPYTGDKNREIRFIFSSFPNRGLLETLIIFSEIQKEYPNAILDYFCDFDNSWLNTHHGEYMSRVKRMLPYVQGATNHGWVSSVTLREYWRRADIWLYPCVFSETCCLTAYEAAVSKTLVVTNRLAALSESVGDRGIIIDGDASTKGWQLLAKARILNILDGRDNANVEQLIEKNYSWITCKQKFSSTESTDIVNIPQMSSFLWS